MKDNKILALKYRPQEFKDLIGQEVMSETITNAIKLNKTPNAYLLTGIRGVGKTTTARLIAKALNCTREINKGEICSAEKKCEHCSEIINSNHIDILEMDAASRTGIDDVRELIENSKYSPTSAKYKIFIIDEVHMLSKQAFNGLLKTLEEPPPRLKFILATTEVKKIPVTILSRCQRFDLKRVKLEKLFLHLKNILKKENGSISDNALKVIARTSEGSVRDAISLLDRALIAKIKNKQVDDKDIREMLGLANRSTLILLFKEILEGNELKAINYLKELINSGLDAKNFLNDILELLYLFSRRVNLGSIEKDAMISEQEVELIEKYSKNLDMQDLGLFWQLTIKTIDDLRVVSNENLTLEMFVMQLIHLKSISSNEQVTKNVVLNDNETTEKKFIKNEKDSIDLDTQETIIKSQLKNTEQIKKDHISDKIELNKKEDNKIKNILSFKELIKIANQEKEVELKYDLERNVKLVSFQKGKIDITFNDRLNKNFIKLLTDKLFSWTGERWIISLSKTSGAKTFYESSQEEKIFLQKKVEKTDEAKKILSAFPDAKIISVSEDKND